MKSDQAFTWLPVHTELGLHVAYMCSQYFRFFFFMIYTSNLDFCFNTFVTICYDSIMILFWVVVATI